MKKKNLSIIMKMVFLEEKNSHLPLITGALKHQIIIKVIQNQVSLLPKKNNEISVLFTLYLIFKI